MRMLSQIPIPGTFTGGKVWSVGKKLDQYLVWAYCSAGEIRKPLNGRAGAEMATWIWGIFHSNLSDFCPFIRTFSGLWVVVVDTGPVTPVMWKNPAQNHTWIFCLWFLLHAQRWLLHVAWVFLSWLGPTAQGLGSREPLSEILGFFHLSSRTHVQLPPVCLTSCSHTSAWASVPVGILA